MPTIVTIPDGYGYTALIALGIIPVLSFAQGTAVGRLRKQAKVPLPNHYATAEQVKKDPAAYKFNCAQRAHGNLLENMSQTIAMLLFSGLFFPKAAAIAGAGWTVSRGLYAYGYITSDANGRQRSLGSPFWLFQAGLLGMSVYGALTLV